MDTPKQESKVPNEAGFSMNMYLSNEHMGRVQFTFRGATSDEWGIVLEDVGRFAAYMKEKGWRFDGESKPQAVAVNPSDGEIKYIPVDDHGNEQPAVKVAIAGRLSWEAKDGKTFFKVMDIVVAAGEKGTKYGVNVWPETLKAANLDVSDLNKLPDIHGWRIDYVCNDKGYPQKVTRLLPQNLPTF